MYVIIVGGGKVGYYLAKELVDQGHEVLVIERDRRTAEEHATMARELAALLQTIAQRLKACVRSMDFVARLGGDEFAILVDDPVAPSVALHIAERLLRALQAPHVRARLEGMGGEVHGSSPQQMRARIADELQRWRQVVSDAKIPQQ